MVANQIVNLDSVFNAMASSTRRKILVQLAQEELTVQDLAYKNKISKQAVSKQVTILVKSGLIKQRKSGRQKYCRLDPEPLGKFRKYLDQLDTYWAEKLKSLKKKIEGTL
jgi:DNA-binding transcriptional ArsR family regulator